MMQNNRGVIVTGMGAFGSFGQGVSTLTTALQNGETHFTSFTIPELNFPIILAALPNFKFEESLESTSLPQQLLMGARKAGRRSPLTIQASLLSALEAWEQARLSERSINPSKIGVVIAGSNTTQGYQNKIQQDETLTYLSPTYALHFMDSDQIGTLTDVFGIKGESYTVGGASASGNVAIIQGYRLIQQGILDVCLVVGVLADLSPKEFQGFYSIGAMGGRKFQDTPAKACRPFDEEHEGFILGQASGCLILESCTVRHNEPVSELGKIIGTGFTLDGHRLSEPNSKGEAEAMNQALMNASLNKENIDYINSHGSSSPKGDETEVDALKAVFGSLLDKIRINSTKSIIGHCLWSAGIMEAIATFVQFEHQFLHPNLNLDNPIDTHCRFVGKFRESTVLQNALSNSFGFGGINTSVVLTKGETNHACRH